MAIAYDEDYEFRDSGSLVRWVRWSLYATLVVSAPALISGFIEHDLLTQVRDGADVSEDLVAAAQASEIRQRAVGLAQIVITIVSGFLSLRWIWRADTNARALGAAGLARTPKWAVAWFFMPILNFWKPYTAMKQIWQASANPRDWRSVRAPDLLGWWWLLWIVELLVNRAAYQLSTRAELVSELTTANEVTLTADFLMIPLTVVFLVIVQRIHAMQSATAARAPVETPPVLQTETRSQV